MMIFISILTLIVAKALPFLSTNITNVQFRRITSIVFIYTSLLILFSINQEAIGTGIYLYNGLLLVTQFSQIIEIIIFIIGALILIGWPLLSRGFLLGLDVFRKSSKPQISFKTKFINIDIVKINNTIKTILSFCMLILYLNLYFYLGKYDVIFFKILISVFLLRVILIGFIHTYLFMGMWKILLDVKPFNIEKNMIAYIAAIFIYFFLRVFVATVVVWVLFCWYFKITNSINILYNVSNIFFFLFYF